MLKNSGLGVPQEPVADAPSATEVAETTKESAGAGGQASHGAAEAATRATKLAKPRANPKPGSQKRDGRRDNSRRSNATDRERRRRVSVTGQGKLSPTSRESLKELYEDDGFGTSPRTRGRIQAKIKRETAKDAAEQERLRAEGRGNVRRASLNTPVVLPDMEAAAAAVPEVVPSMATVETTPEVSAVAVPIAKQPQSGATRAEASAQRQRQRSQRNHQSDSRATAAAAPVAARPPPSPVLGSWLHGQPHRVVVADPVLCGGTRRLFVAVHRRK